MKRWILVYLFIGLMWGILWIVPQAIPVQAAPPSPTAEIRSDILQMSAETGRSLTVFSRMPRDWTTDHRSDVLACGNYYGALSGEPTYARTYLWFPISALPEGERLRRATLEVHTQGSPFAGEAAFNIYRVSEDWQEESGDSMWDERADYAATPVATCVISSTAAPGWVSWDVTPLVSDWLSGVTNYGMMLAAAPNPDALPEESGNWAVSLYGRTSSDPDLAPRLRLEYAPVVLLPRSGAPYPPPLIWLEGIGLMLGLLLAGRMVSEWFRRR